MESRARHARHRNPILRPPWIIKNFVASYAKLPHLKCRSTVAIIRNYGNNRRNLDHDAHLPERCLYVLLLLRHLLDAFWHCGHVI
jgi:hypothetical protein